MSATPPPPVDVTVDRNNVNLGARQVALQTDDLSIGTPSSGMVYSRYWNGSGWRDSLMATIKVDGQMVTVSYGNESQVFWGNHYGYTAARAGTSLQYSFTDHVYTWTNASGRVVKFPNIHLAPNPLADSIIEVVEPSGEVIKLTHKAATYQSCTTGASCTTRILRLQSATSTAGYQAKLEYQSNDTTSLATESGRKAWLNVSKVTLLNNAVDYCNPSADQCAFSRAWPSATYASTPSGTNTLFTVTDALSRTTRYTFDSFGFLTAVKRPTATSDNVTYKYHGPANKRSIEEVNQGGNIWRYAYGEGLPEEWQTTVDITDPALNYRSIVMNGDLPLSVRDSLNNVTNLQPAGDDQYHSIEMPEGDKVNNTFDGRRNIVQTVRSAKPGSGLASITTSSAFPTTCSNPVTCNQPISTTDAKGNVTEYTYDPTHGGILTITAPAPTPGAVRPQTRYTYTPLYAWYKNSAGAIVQAPSPIYRLTGISLCRTTASCAGTADEVKTTIAYGTSGAANNLLPTSVTTSAGDGSLSSTTAFTYDEVGNRLTTDGPLSGAADTVRIRYDAARQVVGIVHPDPDGSGSRKHAAERFTYNADGQVTVAETGTVNSQSDADWALFAPAQAVTTTYDAKARKSKEVLSAGGVAYQVTQYSYDALDRLECTAVRVNSALWNALPVSACTAQTAGAAGPDRITRNTYDAASRLLKVQTAYGTVDQADEFSATHTNNGKLASLTDGQGNRTTFEYDGHDRQVKTRYPVPTAGANASSTSDYEELGYDANGNILSRRLRNGHSITYAYDALNRLSVKSVPAAPGGGAAYSVHYGYDLRSLMTHARFGSASGNGITMTYDALGRLDTETSNMDGTARGFNSDYDLAGNRTLLTGINVGAYYQSYAYSPLGERTSQGGSSSTNIWFGYDDLGRRVSLGQGLGTVSTATSYGYDAASRLSSLSHDLVGTNGDVSFGFGYNPANEIVQNTRSNDAYAWDDHFNVDRNYVANGLNQYTASGGGALAYDANGNLASDGATAFVYDNENRMVSATGAKNATLAYDPLGRLWQLSSPAGTTRFVYDGDRLTAEFDGAGTLLRSHVFGPGTDEVLRTSGPGFLKADERGSIVAMASDAGNLVYTNSYDEYGIPASTNQGRFGYTGQAWIPELGMYYYKARIYSPTLGRFMQTDPVGYDDGMNMYAYVGNDPVNTIDPLGLYGDEIVVTGTAIGSGGVGGGSGGTGHVGGGVAADDPAILVIGTRQRKNRVLKGPPQREEGKACRILRTNSTSTQGVLPGYVTGNKNWNNQNTLKGYRAYYQSNADQWAVLASRPVQYAAAVALAFVPIVRPVGKLAAGIGGAAFSDVPAAQLKLNLDRVKALDERLKLLESGC